MLQALWNDESGFIVSMEMVLIATVAVIGLVVGLSEVAVAVNTELNDISNALGALQQSYATPSFKGTDPCTYKQWAFFSGSYFRDFHDDGDNNQSCDIVCGVPNQPTCG